ncbi:hypothetical protein PMAC_000481 [Pneumocystis sp. 'macacae']|nr:hypothetical protein PMAC_000481 [Pneumocystis sp. 'macacae']
MPFFHKLSDVPSSSIQSTTSYSVRTIHDAFRFGFKSLPLNMDSYHPLEVALNSWEHKMYNLKMQSLDRIFGISEPIRRKMELKILDSGFRSLIFGKPSNIHHDILNGNDSDIDIDEIFFGFDFIFFN